jgi:hypothetical protein
VIHLGTNYPDCRWIAPCRHSLHLGSDILRNIVATYQHYRSKLSQTEPPRKYAAVCIFQLQVFIVVAPLFQQWNAVTILANKLAYLVPQSAVMEFHEGTNSFERNTQSTSLLLVFSVLLACWYYCYSFVLFLGRAYRLSTNFVYLRFVTYNRSAPRGRNVCDC